MLDFDPNREGAPPRDAATLVLLRDGPSGLEVFCVERHKTGFLGGAIVFPGGKVDAADNDPAWRDLATTPRKPRTPIAPDDDVLRALGVATCRESLEEAAILPVGGGAVTHDDLLVLRKRISEKTETLASFLRTRGLVLDLAALHPFARWVTPAAESRRFDARFFLAIVSKAQRGAHDDHETMASFWASPADVLRRFVAGELQLAPPTHRTLEILAAATSAGDAIAHAADACLDPICPQLVSQKDARGDALALVLPGDPEHAIREARAPGKSRYVLRGGRWLPEDPPAG